MLVSHRKEFIYTKTYKTASTSIELFFEPYCLPEEEGDLSHRRQEQVTEAGIVGCRGYDPEKVTWYNHMPAVQIRKKIGTEVWNSYYKFCSIRNPFDKAVSMYNNVRSSSDYGYVNNVLRGKIASMNKYILKLDFERFIKSFDSDRDKYTIDGKFCLDGVIFFEHIKEDIWKMANKVGVKKESKNLPRLKSSNRITSCSTYEYYTDKSREYIEREFAFELEQFGYTFPGPEKRSKPSDVSREEFTPSVKDLS